MLLGDLNARIGDYYDLWPSCMGHFGAENVDSNGQHLLELYCKH